MRRLLNTLFVTIPESYLSRDGENLIVKVNDEVKFRVPIFNLESVICFNHMGASPSAMQLCMESGVSLNFMSSQGKFIARVNGRTSGNVLLRRKQYKLADDREACLRFSKLFVASKIHNSRTVLQRTLREHKEDLAESPLSFVISKMNNMIQRVKISDTLDSVRGIEGEAASAYFSCFDFLILKQKDSLKFHGRIKRPPTDEVNALLSFVYTLLSRDCSSALESVGLDPQVGYMHTVRPGRESLALDLMEELRAYLGDRLVLSLINKKIINPEGFKVRENGSVLMDDETKRAVILAWQTRKKEEITHPFLGEQIAVGQIPFVQSLLLARNIRGDMDQYPPFLWK
jgi:CRISPR-associated protein, Cas1 family